MTLLSLPIMLENAGNRPLQVTSVQLTTQLAGHVAVSDDGRLMDPGTWVVRHIRTGVEIEKFQHWDSAQVSIELTALRRFAEWMERTVDLDSSDGDVLFTRLSALGEDVADLVGFYSHRINDWAEPQACACGVVNADPASGRCTECRSNAEQAVYRSHTSGCTPRFGGPRKAGAGLDL